MNLRTSVKGAKTLFEAGRADDAGILIENAEAILAAAPSGLPAVCCFHADAAGTIWCDDVEVLPSGEQLRKGPYLPGKADERIVSCRKCRAECAAEIERIKEAIT